ncbi:MAG: hypothetical protein U9O91_08215 [Candidatus Caldatribacteriota bacterium]|nr:hypothetical protein [Candidatus Caldatribacteriota bacterium]
MRISNCVNCWNEFEVNPRVKNQMYCNDSACRKARRAVWQREKMAKDHDYRENQKRCQKDWIKMNQGYYKDYRQKNPEYATRNKLMQISRNAKRGKGKISGLIAKMDSLGRINARRGEGLYRLVFQGQSLIAKMDSLIVKLIPCRGLESRKTGFN